MNGTVLQPVRATFRAVAVTVVPDATSLSAEGWTAVEQVVERTLSARPDAVRRQVVRFLRLVEFLPVFRYLRRFSHLSPARRHAVLERLERSARPLLRRGLWGVRTLVFLGYYTRPDVQYALGYRADARGWSARRPAASDAGDANDAGNGQDDTTSAGERSMGPDVSDV